VSDNKGRGPPRPITAQDVQAWFRDAVGARRWPIPDIEACERVAAHCRLFATYHERPPRERILGPAEKYARLFLQHLPAAHEKIEKARNDPSISTDAKAGFLMILAEMNEAEKHVCNVLTLLNWPDSRPSWHDTARLFHGVAWGAWLDAGERPRSLNPEDPPVVFVQKVLEAVGIDKTPESVSAALRGRRGRRQDKN